MSEVLEVFRDVIWQRSIRSSSPPQRTDSGRVLVMIGKEAAESLLVLGGDGNGLESFPDLCGL